ncbi:glycoside hydrolase family 30 beta sandwich domain-containing protein [Marinobacter sp. TBZ242]|uniref:Glycoside hydrolase family 30 beta sandwich domain-containing protein n=1 Tax=Marinobacter azerbaijanicus TaxID=3050455 RepID=A0ABT7I6N5_9GAMM|nr:glycoside hydrolase family 30 beta sandwich domain-containing protein [Marinobacter sp. TBZ242]MDL0429757.1 glycoside hydrolase family 30 beta sandwich domain-containing protein [Marinobacter sp. TBZ242]
MKLTIESLSHPSRLASTRWSGLFRILAIVFSSLLGACAASPHSLSADAGKKVETINVRIDNAIEYQEMAGFGATTLAGIMVAGNGVRDLLSSGLRDQAVKAIYGDVGLNLGSLQLWLEPENDNEDPLVVEKEGFRWDVSDAILQRLVRHAEPFGFSDYSLGLTIDLRTELSWMKELRERSYRRYLQEVAEHVVAGVSHWQEITGATPKHITLFNEPLSGNRELEGGSLTEVVDIIKIVGKRLQDAGFSRIKFIVPAEETVAKSIETSQAILADAVARSYVGALAYHAYPYDSAYSSARRILETSARGLPDKDEIHKRKQLYELAARHDIPVWMTEASEGPGRADYPFGSPENLRARANHIHDELVYANASAYFAMYNLWDRQSHEAHFQDRGIDLFSESSHVVLADQTTSTIHISGIGYAIGHFARWVLPGSVRIDAESDDPLLKVSAFRSDKESRLVLMVINNASSAAKLNFNLKNMTMQGAATGEYSDRASRWKDLSKLTPQDNKTFQLTVGPTSVTSVAVSLMALD